MDLSEHVSEEATEQYALGSLPAPEVEPFEKRLLLCPACQDRLSGSLDSKVAARAGIPWGE